MRRGPAAVRSLVPHRLALTAVMLTAILAATLLSGLVSFAAIVTSYAVRVTLASSPATSILITSSAGSGGRRRPGLHTGGRGAAPRAARRPAQHRRLAGHRLPEHPRRRWRPARADPHHLTAGSVPPGVPGGRHLAAAGSGRRRGYRAAGRGARGNGRQAAAAPRQHTGTPGGHHRSPDRRAGHRDLPPVGQGRCVLDPGPGGCRASQDGRRVHHLPVAGGQPGGHDRARYPGQLRFLGGGPGHRPDRDRQPVRACHLARPGPERPWQLRRAAECRGDDGAADAAGRPGTGRGGGQVPASRSGFSSCWSSREPPSPWPSRC